MSDNPQSNTAQIRRLLNQSFDDPGLDAFCQDYFPVVFDRFSRGMRKDEKITLLLDHCRRTPDGFERLQNALQDQLQDNQVTLNEIKELGQAAVSNTAIIEAAEAEPASSQQAEQPEATTVSSTPSEATVSTLKEKTLKLLRDPIWQAVAVGIGLVTLCWAVYTFLYGNGMDSPPATSTSIVAEEAELAKITSTSPFSATAKPILSTPTVITPSPVPTVTNDPKPPSVTSIISSTRVSSTISPTATAVRVTVTPIPTPTSTPHYPPPSPVPGVPVGPLSNELETEMFTECNAVEYLGPYSRSDKRIHIAEPDDVAAKAAAGSIVYRAWRLKNIGTCDWGPGYKLAFYGGDPLGSASVSFGEVDDSIITNEIVDNETLIVPEGNSGQVAIAEVEFKVPFTTGITQSYWRMRDPQGVFFGPIVGSTMEVVGDCKSGGLSLYGRPIINKFELIQVGDIYFPPNPINAIAQIGEQVTVEWDLLNTTEYSLTIDDSRNRTVIPGSRLSDKYTIELNKLGKHTISLIAKNGNCESLAKVELEVSP